MMDEKTFIKRSRRILKRYFDNAMELSALCNEHTDDLANNFQDSSKQEAARYLVVGAALHLTVKCNLEHVIKELDNAYGNPQELFTKLLKEKYMSKEELAEIFKLVDPSTQIKITEVQQQEGH